MVAYCSNDDGDCGSFSLLRCPTSLSLFFLAFAACYACVNNRTSPICLKRLPRVKCLSRSFVFVERPRHYERGVTEGKYEKHETNLIGQTLPIKITVMEKLKIKLFIHVFIQ